MTSVLSDIVKVTNLDIVLNDDEKTKSSIENGVSNSGVADCSAEDTLDTSSSSKITSSYLFGDKEQTADSNNGSGHRKAAISASNNNNSSESDLVSSVSTAATSIAKNNSDDEDEDEHSGRDENEQQINGSFTGQEEQDDAVDPVNAKASSNNSINISNNDSTLLQRPQSSSISNIAPNLSDYTIQEKSNTTVNHPRAVRSKSASNVIQSHLQHSLPQPPNTTNTNNAAYMQQHSNSSMSSFASSILINNNNSNFHRSSNSATTTTPPPASSSNMSRRGTFPQMINNNDVNISVQSSIRSRNNSTHTYANASAAYTSGTNHHYYGTSSSGFDERASLSSSKLNESATEEIQRMKFMVLNKREIKKNKKKFSSSSTSDFFNAASGNNNAKNKSAVTTAGTTNATFNDGTSIITDINNLHNYNHSSAHVDALIRQIPTTRTLSENVNVGTGLNKVYEGHGNFIMAYNMLTGIRVAVSRCSGIMKPLKEQDYKSTKKLTFDIVGNELTPSSKYDFKFKDYAPNVFRELREMFGLDPADYLVSLTAKYVLSEMNSPGKSGSFFYYSRDYKFIIKTIHRSEHITLRRILKNYHEHVKSNPNTLVSQFYGLHRLKMPLGKVPLGSSRKIYFIVMNNLFPPNYKIDRTYDLKGSLWKRETIIQNEKDTEKLVNSNNTQNKYKGKVLKDQNWLNNKEYLRLKGTKHDAFITQLSRDVQFLIKSNIMDYSLLLGIYQKKKQHSKNSNYSKKKASFKKEKTNEDFDSSHIDPLIDNIEKLGLSKKGKNKAFSEADNDAVQNNNEHNKNINKDSATATNNKETSSNGDEDSGNIKTKIEGATDSGLTENGDGDTSAAAVTVTEADANNDTIKLEKIHDKKKEEEEVAKENGTTTNTDKKDEDKPAVTAATGDSVVNNEPLKEISSSVLKPSTTQERRKPQEQAASSSTNVNDILKNEKFYFYSYMSGFNAADSEHPASDDEDNGSEDSDMEEIVYYIGIIDCLTNYSLFKRAETFVKGFYQNRKEISAVPAHEYGDRFLRFIKEKAFK